MQEKFYFIITLFSVENNVSKKYKIHKFQITSGKKETSIHLWKDSLEDKTRPFAKLLKLKHEKLNFQNSRQNFDKNSTFGTFVS